MGGTPFAPKVRLDGELGAIAARERATRRLEAFVAEAARPAFAGLARLKAAADGETLRGLARGLAYQLVEAAGAVSRRDADEYVRALYRAERKALRELGVRFGAFTLFVEDLVAPETAWIRDIFAELAAPHRRPDAALAALPRDACRMRRCPIAACAPSAASPPPSSRWSASATSPAPPRPASRCRRRPNSAGRRPRRNGCCERSASSRRRAESGGAALWRRRGPARPQVSEAPAAEAVEPCRIDVWLWRARFCKTRAQAAKRVADGEIAGMRQGAPIALDKPSRQIRPGDVLTLAIGGRSAALRVQAVGARRGLAAEARQLYSLLSTA